MRIHCQECGEPLSPELDFIFEGTALCGPCGDPAPPIIPLRVDVAGTPMAPEGPEVLRVREEVTATLDFWTGQFDSLLPRLREAYDSLPAISRSRLVDLLTFADRVREGLDAVESPFVAWGLELNLGVFHPNDDGTYSPRWDRATHLLRPILAAFRAWEAGEPFAPGPGELRSLMVGE